MYWEFKVTYFPPLRATFPHFFSKMWLLVKQYYICRPLRRAVKRPFAVTLEWRCRYVRTAMPLQRNGNAILT